MTGEERKRVIDIEFINFTEEERHGLSTNGRSLDGSPIVREDLPVARIQPRNCIPNYAYRYARHMERQRFWIYVIEFIGFMLFMVPLVYLSGLYNGSPSKILK